MGGRSCRVGGGSCRSDDVCRTIMDYAVILSKEKQCRKDGGLGFPQPYKAPFQNPHTNIAIVRFGLFSRIQIPSVLREMM